MKLLLPAFALATLGQMHAQQITLAEGSSKSNLSILVLEEAKPKTPAKTILTQLEFLPIEMSNRTEQQRLRSDVSRRIERQGLFRVELPSGGRLFQYKRKGGLHYGYLLISAQGKPTIVLELPGQGLSGTGNPFADRLGVSPDGKWGAVTTLLGALYALRLDGGVYSSTSKPARQISVPAMPAAMALSPGRSILFFVTTNERIWRCPLADHGKAVDVTPKAPPGSRLKDELAISGDGRTVAFLLGPKKLFEIYLLRETGTATKLALKPSKYEEPGYLPETPGGPRLLLNSDSTRLYFIDAISRDEHYLVDTSNLTSIVHMTGDKNFVPYVGTGIFPTFIANLLVMGIGNPKAFDLYSADTKSPAVRNLSKTNNNTKAPFATGNLNLESIAETSNGMVFLTETQGASALRLRLLDPALGKSRVIMTQIESFDLGSALDQRPNLLARSRSGAVLFSGLNALAFLIAPPSIRLNPDVMARGAQYHLFSVEIAGFFIPMLRLSNGSLFPLYAERHTQQIILTQMGGVLIQGSNLVYLSIGGAWSRARKQLLQIPLSGAGA